MFATFFLPFDKRYEIVKQNMMKIINCLKNAVAKIKYTYRYYHISDVTTKVIKERKKAFLLQIKHV